MEMRSVNAANETYLPLLRLLKKSIPISCDMPTLDL